MLLRHVAASPLANAVRLTPVDRCDPQRPIQLGYKTSFRPIHFGELAPAEDPLTIALLDSIQVVDTATPVSEEHADHCYFFLRRLHEVGRLETARLWLQEGCDIVTYGKTQILHARWDDYPSVEMRGAEHVVLNLVSVSTDFSPVFTVMGPDLQLWYDIKLLPSAETLKSVTVIFEHESHERYRYCL